MPLCDACKSEAEWTMGGVTHIGERAETNPPHGLEWGESCDRCDNTARVTI